MCSFVVKLILSQISLILPEFTHFIFITINTHLSIRTQHLPQNTQILSKLTWVVAGPKCSPFLLWHVLGTTKVKMRNLIFSILVQE